MQFVSLIYFITFLSSGRALVRCNGTVTKLQLCFLDSEYDKGLLDKNDQGKIWSSVQIFEISEFDENQQTITLDLVLSVWWYDKRLTIESNTPKQYVIYQKIDKNLCID